jgi:hypothetical protein
MEKETKLLMSRGFKVISIMIDPNGVSNEPFDDIDIFFSVTHRDFSSALRFLKRVPNLQELTTTMKELVRIYDEKSGDVWRLPNSRLALNTLAADRLYAQGTREGLNMAKEILGLTVHEQTRDKPVKKPRL